jgi:fermentation-respiration switch protein FrsA (DUF1100 family)
MTPGWRLGAGVAGAAVLVAAGFVFSQLPAIGAGGLLHPARRRSAEPRPKSCDEETFAGAGVTLRGCFRAVDVSPVSAATRIDVPVLLVHGAADTETPPDHSRRVLAALAGPKRLILVPGARHNESLRGEIWTEIERWLDDVLASVAVPPRHE